jgi:hypothetical protein
MYFTNLVNYPFISFEKKNFYLSTLDSWDERLLRSVKRYIYDSSANSSTYGIVTSLKYYSGF